MQGNWTNGHDREWRNQRNRTGISGMKGNWVNGNERKFNGNEKEWTAVNWNGKKWKGIQGTGVTRNCVGMTKQRTWQTAMKGSWMAKKGFQSLSVRPPSSGFEICLRLRLWCHLRVRLGSLLCRAQSPTQMQLGNHPQAIKTEDQ